MAFDENAGEEPPLWGLRLIEEMRALRAELSERVEDVQVRLQKVEIDVAVNRQEILRSYAGRIRRHPFRADSVPAIRGHSFPQRIRRPAPPSI